MLSPEAERLTSAFWRIPKPDRLHELTRLFYARDISVAVLRELLPWVWTIVEFPGRQPLGRSLTVSLFHKTGFLSDWEGHRGPPSEGLTVYRGCNPYHRLGLSWTTDRAKAEWFAERFACVMKTRVYSAHAPAGHILAMFQARKESEVVVNPAGLEDVSATAWVAKSTAG